MKEITITALTAGQRLDHLLSRYLKEAHSGFLYKMLRKKNITLNGKKATGSEKLKEGDIIRLFFSDETLQKFTGTKGDAGSSQGVPGSLPGDTGRLQGGPGERPADAREPWRLQRLSIIYEDADVLLVNKPAGMLTQKAKPEDVSLNEYALEYLLAERAVTPEDLLTFRPSVCNRLDRNTSGIVAIGKTIGGLQELSRIFKDRSVGKFYKALVAGRVGQESVIDGWLIKDEASNKVRILNQKEAGAQRIRTRYIPVQTVCMDTGADAKNAVSGSGSGCGRESGLRKQSGYTSFFTLLDVELLTGRSHQIRAHLSSIGHPIVGDPKYGDERANRTVKQMFGIRRQMLHAGRLTFPEMEGRLQHLSGKTFTAPLPADFRRVLRAAEADNN